MIALGLVAAAAVAGLEVATEELLAEGIPLEGYGDNLAAALEGGVCLTSDSKIARIADEPPATPIALVPEATVSTVAARDALPAQVAHRDASHTAGRAALLRAALASGSPELFAEALDDQLHEPYRAQGAPLLAQVRRELPAGALATISGSGPTVIVWAAPESASDCTRELADASPDTDVLSLSVSLPKEHMRCDDEPL